LLRKHGDIMKKLQKTLALVIFVFLSLNVSLYADEITEDELARWQEIGMNHRSTTPPTGELRNPAEWETSQGVIIRYPLGISYSLVAEMSEDMIVYTICTSGYYSQAVSNYTSQGVNMENCEFILASTNTHWTRDYGPWFIFTDDEMGIADHIYNRPRPLDDVIPQTIGAEWSMSVYGMDLIATGGNHMSDGLGMSMSTQLTYYENSLSDDEVDSIMLAYLGNDFTVLDYTETGGIHHIDCWAKMLDPTTILIKDVPSGHSSYTRLNQRAEFLSQQISPWGEPYTIVRVYSGYDEPYTNSLILGKKVFVPMDGTSWDDDAIQTYQDAMPGYEILGFYGSWLSDDAIHCRAMGVPDREMLFIKHVPLHDTGDTLNDRLVTAIIEDCSNTGKVSDSLKIYYSVNDGAYTFAPLYSTADPDSFYGHIPVQGPGDQVAYFIKAADYSGRVETHPYIGEPGAHRYEMIYVNNPPEIAEISPKDVDEGQNLAFQVFASDPDGTTPDIICENLPDNADFTDYGEGSGTFEFDPDYTQAGTYYPMFIASDDFDTDTVVATITVSNVNLPPELTEVLAKEVDEGQNVSFFVFADDPDGTTPDLRAEDLPPNASFEDQNNGSGSFEFDPDYTQADIYYVTFIAEDGELAADTIQVTITVHDVNLPPSIDPPDGTLLCRTGDDFGFYPDYEALDDPVVTISYDVYPGWMTVSNDSLVGTTPDDTSMTTFRVIVADEAAADSADVTLFVWACGDANGDGLVDIDDVVWLISYIFSAGSPPYPYESGDVDCQSGIDIDDVVYLIGYIFSQGPEPCIDCP
jgi:agmatine/peptidylarginine deiminase